MASVLLTDSKIRGLKPKNLRITLDVGIDN